ncbi:hypothetical protein V2G26_011909 [Clonostachys chloroleuca]|uniref:ATP-dependent permease n=1 Tax=Clonostachys chloroleuca TaxID=1926264 RepID=A0AA35PVC8_9HYPO|nr:unnamed protein product [Clonostachys chloroleuca]
MAILRLGSLVAAAGALLPVLAGASSGNSTYSQAEMLRVQASLLDGRPSECPPCFNCLLPAHTCAQYAGCNEFNGKCDCPEGFGGDDCLEPLCGSLGRGKDRPMRNGESNCQCDEGWTGINCNVCTDNKACNALMETGTGGVCYQNGEVVKHNYQICDVTNQKITDLLGEQRPEVTFTCKEEDSTCDFQFWVDAVESFYCHLSDCDSTANFEESRNTTSYSCDHITCSCIPGHMLCGKDGSIDLSDFLDQAIRGPGGFDCSQKDGGIHNCAFNEPEMNKLISALIGDSSILLNCQAGECLYETEVPGYKRPVKQINTPLIAGVIAASGLFVVAVIIITWYLSRRKLKYGAIRLEDSDDETTKLMIDHKPVALQFQDITYTLNGKSILSGIQGICRPGEVTAIMGASGAGKTTFLDILARKNKRGQVGGQFYVNGEKVPDAVYKTLVGFVDQEDTMLPTLTVHETILNSALLRLPRHMSRMAKEQRVYEVEKELGIYHIRNSLIGSEEGKGRGISGGEKRRVGIACELVTSPSILFLDEPTSGLDAFNAFNVIECLVTLAQSYKRTVIFTIHQPRSNIAALFDRLILLARGKTVFSGPFNQCQPYFDSLGYECPSGFNIADYLVDLTMHAGNMQLVDDGTVPTDASSLGPSSTRAVKSIASISGGSTTGEATADSVTASRPNNWRKNSIKQRQERELFTRRRTVDTAASSEAGGDDQGFRLQQNPGTSIVNQLAEDAHDLPPSAVAATDLDVITSAFTHSDIAAATNEEIRQSVESSTHSNGPNGNNGAVDGQGASVGIGKGYQRIGYARQFIILSNRTWKNLYRNPMLMLTHYAIAIVLAVFSGYLFYGLTDDIPGFQNRLGLFFFLLALFGFSTLTSLNVFASERLLFVRERANGYYAPATYFAAKVLFDIIPLRIIPPILMGSIVYPMTGLVADSDHFFKFMLVLVLFNLAAAAICLFIGIVCKDGGVASLIGSLVMLFSLLFAGFLLNHDATPKSAIWLQSLSIFHYAFESLIVNEVLQLTLIDKKYGLDITVPGAAILSSFGFENSALWSDIRNLGIFAAMFIILAYIAMHVLLVERR